MSANLNPTSNNSSLPPELRPFRLLTEQQVSLLTGRALQSLRNDRCMQRGLPYVKLTERCVRYRLEDLLSYIGNRLIDLEAV
jgi:hypothetical protein